MSQGFAPNYSMPPFMPHAQAFAPMPFSKMPLNNNHSTLYIGDLEEHISEEILYPYFLKFGAIYSLKVMRDRVLKKSRGFAFITYYNVKDAETARNYANHEIILSKPIRVTYYRNPKETSPEANVFLKDLDKSIRIQDIDHALSKYGKIFSSKISTDENGHSRGYGYVQFESKNDADNCLKAHESDPIKVNDKKLDLQKYVPRSDRPNNSAKNNLFLKNLPKVPEGKTEEEFVKELEHELREKFSQDGKRNVTSLLIKNDGSGRFFSFVCFENSADADSALNEFANKESIFSVSSSEPLFVDWAQKKADRLKQLKERKFFSPNETNLYTKGLKKTVQVDDLGKFFSQFGKITSCLVKESPDPRYDTKQGFINFESKEDAHNALIHAENRPEIRGLYANEIVFLSWLLKKENRFSKKRDPRFFPNANSGFPMQMGMEMNPFMMPFMPMPFSQYRPDYMAGYQRPGQMPGNPGPRQGNFQPRAYSRQQPSGVSQFPANNYKNKPYRGGPPQGQNRYVGGGNRPPVKQNAAGPISNLPGMQPNNIPNMEKPIAPSQQTGNLTSGNIRDNMAEFLKLDKNKQRDSLGNMLFPKIKKFADDVLAPKITGMLIDFSVFEVQDIVEFLENEETLKEKIEEAKELIMSQANQ